MTETIDGYQLVAGERRLRAAQAAGLERIPAVVRQLADREQLELALVENLQREDLDPIETRRRLPPARSTSSASPRTHCRDARRARRARPSRTPSASSTSRPDVQAAVADGRLTEGHGRALGGLATGAAGPRPRLGHRPGAVGSPDRGARPATARTEARSPPVRATASTDPDLERVEEDLRRALGTEGQPRPLAARRPHRHRVLQRRRTRASLRAPDRRNRVTEATSPTIEARGARSAPRRRPAAGQDRLRHGRGKRARTRRTTTPPASRSSRASRRSVERPGMYIGSTDERGLHHLVWEVVDNSIDEAMAGQRQRSSRSRSSADGMVTVEDDGRGVPVGKHSTGQGRPRGRPHRPPRRRQVRRRRLQGLGRPARRRRERRQRAVVVDARRVRPRRQFVWAQEYERGKPTTAGQEDRSAGHAARHDDRASWPIPRCSRPPTTRSSSISQRLRESAYLTKRVWITLIDERNRPRALVLLRGRPRSRSSATSTGTRRVLHQPPDLRRAARGQHRPSRSHSSTTTRTPRTSSPSPTTSTRVDGGTPRHRLPRRAHQLAQRLGAPGRRAPATPTATCRATTSARA